MSLPINTRIVIRTKDGVKQTFKLEEEKTLEALWETIKKELPGAAVALVRIK